MIVVPDANDEVQFLYSACTVLVVEVVRLAPSSPVLSVLSYSSSAPTLLPTTYVGTNYSPQSSVVCEQCDGAGGRGAEII